MSGLVYNRKTTSLEFDTFFTLPKPAKVGDERNTFPSASSIRICSTSSLTEFLLEADRGLSVVVTAAEVWQEFMDAMTAWDGHQLRIFLSHKITT